MRPAAARAHRGPSPGSQGVTAEDHRSRSLVVWLVTLAVFTDLLAYAVAVPVLPDLSTRLGARPGVVGLLFSAFGFSLLLVSVPVGHASDRLGRRGLLVGSMAVLAAATVVFAFSTDLVALFAARLVQGVADAVAWTVGFALLADLYEPEHRGRVMGRVMAGAGLGIVAGPPLGGWLYELGGLRLPFLSVAALSVTLALAFLWLPLPPRRDQGRAPIGRVLREPAIAACVAAAVAGSMTLAMLEPVLPLHFADRLSASPGRIGLVFGIAAVASTAAHPLWGRLTDRWGGRPLMVIGLALAGALLPLLILPRSLAAAAAVMVALWPAFAMTITPSLALISDAAERAGIESYGVVYGAYNVAWGIGLLAGPAAGGVLLQEVGFATLCLLWSPALLAATAWIAAASRPSAAVAA